LNESAAEFDEALEIKARAASSGLVLHSDNTVKPVRDSNKVRFMYTIGAFVDQDNSCG